MDKNETAGQDSKRAYVKPQLSEAGRLQEVTRGANSGGADDTGSV